MLQIISVRDLVTVYLKLYFDTYVFTHFQANEGNWRQSQLFRWWMYSWGRKGRNYTQNIIVSGYSFLVLCRCWGASWVFLSPCTSCSYMYWSCMGALSTDTKVHFLLGNSRDCRRRWIQSFVLVMLALVLLTWAAQLIQDKHMRNPVSLLMCQVVQTLLSESAGSEESSSSFPISYLVPCWVHIECRCLRSWRKEGRCLFLRLV